MMFDDYQWKLLKEEYNCPGLGIDVFRSCFRSHFEVVHLGYQFFCRKVSHAPPAVGPLTSTDAMEGEAATTAITSPDVPGAQVEFTTPPAKYAPYPFIFLSPPLLFSFSHLCT